MKRGLFLMATVCCVLFTSCKKDGGGTNTGEDLSYLIKTYERYESGGRIIKNTWTYDGYKLMGYQQYEDGRLVSETKNYSYNGLKASYDSYSYRDGNVNDVSVTHYEIEYLDETFQRTKYRKYYYPNSENNKIYEMYYEYDGKKITSVKSYTNGTLTNESQYNYNDLHCTYTQKWYSSGIVYEQRFYDIVYLDDTYLRQKSYMRTRERYDEDGNITTSSTNNYYYDFDGKKPIGFHSYIDGKLAVIGRDYQYDGLTCYYYLDDIQDGEMVATRMYEVEYLE